jgi:O-antigen/teichoic acid export membrane protein
MGMAQVAVFVFNFSSSVILARFLTPREMGIFAAGLAAVAMLSLLQSFGLNNLIIREKELTERVTATVFTINALIAIAASLAIALCANLGATLFGDEGVTKVLFTLAITPLFGVLSFLPGAQLERHGRFKELAIANLSTSFIGACTTVSLAVLGFSYMSMAYANLVGSASQAAVLIFLGRQYFSCRIGLKDWRRILAFGFQMIAVVGLSSLSNRACDLILGRMLGLAELGLYSRASGIVSMIWGNIHYLISRVLLVDFSAVHRRSESLRVRYIQTTAMVTAMLWPAFAGLAVIAKPLIILLYGRTWVEAAVPLSLLAIASMVYCTITMASEVCIATGNLRTQTRIEAIRAPLSVFAFVGGCFISLEAAAFSRIVDAAIGYTLYRPHLEKMTGTKISDFFGIYAESALLTLIAIAPAGAVMAFSGTGEPPLGPLFASILVGVGLWAGALLVRGHPIAVEIMVVLRNRFPRLRSDSNF